MKKVMRLLCWRGTLSRSRSTFASRAKSAESRDLGRGRERCSVVGTTLAIEGSSLTPTLSRWEREFSASRAKSSESRDLGWGRERRWVVRTTLTIERSSLTPTFSRWEKELSASRFASGLHCGREIRGTRMIEPKPRSRTLLFCCRCFLGACLRRIVGGLP